jgi:DNA-binding transcriptional LysR family regulator
MHRIHPQQIDLNLLRTLAVLLEERQVSRAAARLNLTQSAVSHALQRLRRHFDDRLLIRRGGEMVPTPRAEALAGELEQVLAAIDRIVEPAAFDPATATGTLRIAATDYGAATILPQVVHTLAATAPQLTVTFTDLADDTFERLESGFIDLVLSGQESYRDMRTETLFTERFVIMVRGDHPCLERPMTVAEYTRWPHVVVDLLYSRLLGIDRRLKSLGRQRVIGVRLPHFLAAPFLAQRSELLVPVPERLAEMYATALGLAVVEPPPELDLGRFDYVQMWDRRRDNDPVHCWLRGLVKDCVRAEPLLECGN